MVTLNGRDHYLGKWNTTTSKAEYTRLVGEWVSADGGLSTSQDLTVAELCVAYWRYAKGYYVVKPGGSRGTVERVTWTPRLNGEDGHLSIPTAPGLGLDLNLDVAREHPYDPASFFDATQEGWEKRLGVRDGAKK